MNAPEEERAVLGLLVVLLRSLRHWSQTELARASGIQRSQITLYELCQTLPTEATLKRIAAAAGVTWAAARKALPAIRALYRLAKRPVSLRPAFPVARKLSAPVGQAAAGAFQQSVRPFLRERLPALAGSEPPVPKPLPDRSSEAAVLGLLIILFRTLRRRNQGELASAAGVQGAMISDYERGKKAPRRRTLERLAAALGVHLGEALEVLPVLRELVQEAHGGPRCAAVTPEGIGKLAGNLFLLEVGSLLPERLPALAGQAAAYEARRRAEVPFQELMSRPSTERWRMVEAYEAYRTWALCERAAFESERKAAHNADEASDLARLAVRMAELTPGSEGWRSRVGGLCQGFLANALRVKGDFPAAEEAFLRSDHLWQVGAAADPGLILDGTRLLDLKASLRRFQGRFQESLDLLDQALAASRSGEATARLLLKKAGNLRQMGDWQGAVDVLNQARPRVEKQGDLRNRWGLEYSLCRVFSDAGLYPQADELLPKVTKLALDLGNGLDLLRSRWLQGLVFGGLGRLEEAVDDLEHVAGEFVARGIAFDAALACLDLAQLYLQQGRTAEVKRLSAQMVVVFKAQRVHREALAAVILFQEAAEQERVTVELARKLSDYLRRAQHSPGLRFEP